MPTAGKPLTSYGGCARSALRAGKPGIPGNTGRLEPPEVEDRFWAGLVILLSGRLDRLDPAVSLGIGLLIAWQAWKLLHATTDVLLESTPKGLDPDEIAAVMEAVDGVEAVHDLHVSSEVRALSAHVVLAGHPTLEEAQEVGIDVKRAIALPCRIAHATFELECEHCVDDGSWCPMGDVAAAAYQRGASHHH